MVEADYDLLVIGGGPGGYVCAIRASQLGFRTAVVESRATLGGTCLNVGCIPSKALLQASEKFQEAQHGLAAFGVKVGAVALDLPAMLAFKDKVVEANVRGIEFLFKKHKIDWIKGRGRLTAPGVVAVGERSYRARHVAIATGSVPIDLPGVAVDEDRILSSTGALALPAVPRDLAVIGGGYIGLELGSVWARLGAKVTVVEFLDRIVASMDAELGRHLERVLKKQGLSFKLGTKVLGAEADNEGVTLALQNVKTGAAEELRCERLLVAVGRKPMTEGLGLAEVGIALDDKGRIVTDAQFRTSLANHYAVGDAIAGPMLAHKAEEEGVALAELLAGQAGHVNYETVPGIVYTWPEVATVGKTEEELRTAGVDYRVGKFPFTANGRARAMNATEGFVKILADATSDRILGVHIVGPEAGTLIHEAVVAMEFGGAAEDLARSFHAHPTLNEAVKEAALAVAARPLHL